MKFRNPRIILTLGLILFSSSACTMQFGKDATQHPGQRQPVIPLGAARTATPQQTPAPLPPPPATENSIYLERVREMFYQRQFAWLDAEAGRLRASKERLTDGAWKLFIFYAAVDDPDTARAGEEGWPRYLSLLREWV